MTRPTLGLLALAVIVGCDTGSRDHDPSYFVGPSPSSGLGELRVSVSDAPPDLSALRTFVIEIDRIEVVGTIDSATGIFPIFDASTGTPFLNPPQTNTGPPGGGPQRVDLFALRGGPTALVAQVFLPPGRIDQVRLFLSRAEVTLAGLSSPTPQTFSTTNGRLGLSGVSAAQPVVATISSGVVIAPGSTSEVLLDFDLASSLDVQGDPSAPDSITFTPLVRARTLGGGGSIAGVVRSDNGTPSNLGDDFPLANARISLLDANDQLVAVTSSDSLGVFTLPGIPGQTFSLLATSPGFALLRQNISVSGGRVTQDLLLSAAALGALPR